MTFSIQELCKKYNLSPKHFAFEVTETAFISDTNLASDVLNRLQKLGFSISLDDFGTGYSSLMYLRSMPLSSVKIDRSFTKD
ncbi:MAG: EAL domain-containing protein, partial [Thalassolituus sp.]